VEKGHHAPLGVAIFTRAAENSWLSTFSLRFTTEALWYESCYSLVVAVLYILVREGGTQAQVGDGAGLPCDEGEWIMSTDTRRTESCRERRMTLADLCQAIAEGRVPYTVRDGQYQIKRSDLRRSRARAAQPDLSADLIAEPRASSLHMGSFA
jgi:hypothetical protein